MIIELKKIGTTLISRQTGKEAYLAIQPILREMKEGENVEVDFTGVLTFSPSWGDEFLTPLMKKFGKNILLKHTANLSVSLTIEVLEKINGYRFRKSK